MPRAQNTIRTRRSLLAALTLLPLGIGITARGQSPTARLAPTPAQTEGPFYPRTFPVDRDGDLTRVAGRSEAAQGKPLYLRGVVKSTGGAPLPGTVVELWQCDALGRYHHAGDATPQDENFQGYGRVTADGEGRYSFKTIRPVAYGSRPPHLHFKLAGLSGSSLTTQLYVRGDATEGDGVLAALSRDARARLVMTLIPLAGREPDALAAEFDFVLRV
ncbi:MAG: intradiol ring-cleavage dioxygenase [Casimicrobiaceae bacterium]